MRLLCPCLSGERGEGGHWTRRKNDISKKDTEKGPVLEAGSSGFPSRTKVQGQAATPRALGPQMMVMGRLEMLHCPGWGGGKQPSLSPGAYRILPSGSARFIP